ncbi:MAG: N-acetylmuramoyl-L-alanine amidase [Dehalococcoidia bacterium]
MDHQHLSRRRLLWSTALSTPLLAACSDKVNRTADLEATSPPAADVEAANASPAPAASEPAPSPESTAGQAMPAVETPASRPRTIVLDPGHGAEEIGAASAIAGMPNLAEKDSNLAFSWRLRALLESDGYRVVMTRETDSRAFGYVRPENPSPGPGGLTPARADLQARVDFANQSEADLFLSVHSNDSGSLEENGVEVWYCGDREAGDRNGIWAQIVLEDVLDHLRGYGYRANNRGTKEDRFFRVRNGRNFHIFVLGPPNPDSHHPRATMMPAALVENLFMRHARDQYVLRDPDAREAIAQGMRRAVHHYFEWQGG